MKRVVDSKIILCPMCGKEMGEISYERLFKRDNGKELIQFVLGCPNSGCETEVTHTTFMEFERSVEWESREAFQERMTFEDEMALDY